MAARPRVLAGVPVGGVIAALGRAALLAGTQVDPPRTDLHALLALPALRVPDGGNRGDVHTRLVGHGLVLSDVAAPRVFHREHLRRAGFEGLGEPARRTTARKCHVFPAGAERRRRLTAHEARGSTSRHHPAALPRVFSGGHVPRPLRDECHVPGVRTPVRARTRFFQGAMYVSYGIGIVYIGVLAILANAFLVPRIGVVPAAGCIVAIHLACVPAVFRYSRVIWAHLNVGTLRPS